jgi:GMP synthase-like glutamine amidotransferase
MSRALLSLLQCIALTALPLIGGCVAIDPLVTPSPVPTSTPSPSPTATSTPTASATPTSTPTPTPEPTATPRGHLEVAVILHGPSRFFQVDRVLAANDASSVPILAYQGETVPDLRVFDAVILTGGEYPPSRFDEVEFLQQERERVLEAIEGGVPILGICLGHQLLAHWLGGRVERGPQFEVGWLQVAIGDQGLHDPLLEGLATQFYTFLWHWDQVVELPPGGVNLASSDLCPIQIFRYRDLPVWGVQSNPQYDAGLAEAALLGANWLADLGVDAQAMASKGFEVDGGSQDRIFENFFSYVRTH